MPDARDDGRRTINHQTTCHATCSDLSAPCLFPALLEVFLRDRPIRGSTPSACNGGVPGKSSPAHGASLTCRPIRQTLARHPGLRAYGRTSLIRWGERVAGDAADAHVERGLDADDATATRPRPWSDRTVAARPVGPAADVVPARSVPPAHPAWSPPRPSPRRRRAGRSGMPRPAGSRSHAGTGVIAADLVVVQPGV